MTEIFQLNLITFQSPTDLDSTYVYTRAITGIHKKSGFTDARVICIPPKSYPEATVLWSNKTKDDFLDFKRNSRVRRVDDYVRDGVKYYSLVIKNAVDLVGQSYGCVVYNKDIGNKPFYVANSKIVIYGKSNNKSNHLFILSNRCSINLNFVVL